ncbi:hypothetical protein BLOT_002229 [Blomia tropicalis]|nr:hypothetical protein BLOT_002229 [Blomia tropicalis]
MNCHSYSISSLNLPLAKKGAQQSLQSQKRWKVIRLWDWILFTVVEQRFAVEVYDEFVTAGNAAILRCHMPPFVRDLLDIVAWIEGSSNYIFPSSQTKTDNKYRVLTTGELYIQNVDPNDGMKSFRCQVKHRITNEKILSINSGRLFVSEAYTKQAPRIVDSKTGVIAEEGKSVEIGCLAQGNPPPTYTWFRNTEILINHKMDSIHNYLMPRIHIMPNSIYIENVSTRDAGIYRCIANNSLGSEIVETQLIVRFFILPPLNVQIGLPMVRVDLGHSLTLNCTVSGGPVKSIEWLHNGRPISAISSGGNIIGGNGGSAGSGGSSLRVRLLSREVLHIGKVTRTDRGMYQCVAFNDYDSASAQVQLELGDDAPQLLSVFTEQTLQPGQPLTLKCIASGNPIPQVVWHIYDNLPIPDHIARYRIGDYVTRDSLLVSYVNISSVLPEDGGLYTCSATNDVATVSHSARINVFGKPSLRRMSNMTSVAGESIFISCPVGGYPIDVIIWERDGVRLPYNHRQKVFPNGTLTVNELERVTDEGLYTCIARTQDDPRSSAKTSFSLKVLVRPVIEPFKFPKSLHQSQRYNLLCTVVKGDPPVKIEWYKDGRKLITGMLGKTNIIHVTEYSVTLAFESVQPEHRGNYTCVASNSAGSSSHSASMIIHVPPRWRIEPIDATVVKGKNSVIDCDTDAYPLPTITWSRADGSNRELPSDFKPVNSNGHLRPYENGSLAIHNAHKSDTGYYMCAASNGIGPGISKVIKITVNVAAHFETKFRTETVHRGLEARIKCSAVGDKPITISWFKDKTPFVANDDSRFDMMETIMTEGIKSELLIRNSDRRDGGLYTCLTSNSFGRDDTNIQLIVQEPPDAPTDIKVNERDGRTLRLVWSTPYSGNSPLTHYVVQHKLENEKWSSHYANISVLASENSISISGLQPVTAYQVRMFAVNNLGRSESSDILTVQTSEETPGGPPLHIKAMPLSSTSIKINWKPPRKELQYGIIRGYYIGYRIIHSTSISDSSNSADNFVFKTIETKGKDLIEECTITDLKRASRYEVIVQVFNSKGAGPTSEPIYVKTLEYDPPSAPQLQVSEVTISYVRLSWAIMADQIISGYILHYKRESADWEELPPVAPDKNSLLSVNATSATIYLDSFHDGGCKISNFEVMYKPDRGHWMPISHLPLPDQKLIQLNDLSPGSKYRLRITAFNEAGSTEAEYNFMTSYQDDAPVILMGSRATSSSVPFYADILVVVPSVISFVVVVVLLSLVYIIFTRKPRQPNDIYGNFDGDHKLHGEANESVIMGDLDMNHNNGKKGLNLENKFQQSNHHNGTIGPIHSSPNVVHFQTPYAMTNIAETEERLQMNEIHGSPLKSYNLNHDGIYATVKRTPRAPRSDVHIYQYPLYYTPSSYSRPQQQQQDILNLDSDSFDSSGPNSTHSNSGANSTTTGIGANTSTWRPTNSRGGEATMGVYETEMTRLNKTIPVDAFYGHNLFHDSTQA